MHTPSLWRVFVPYMPIRWRSSNTSAAQFVAFHGGLVGDRMQGPMKSPRKAEVGAVEDVASSDEWMLEDFARCNSLCLIPGEHCF